MDVTETQQTQTGEREEKRHGIEKLRHCAVSSCQEKPLEEPEVDSIGFLKIKQSFMFTLVISLFWDVCGIFR